MSLSLVGSLLLGLVFLVVGAEALVRGASALASRFGVSPLVIGLTVVAYGTSAPELAVSLQASLAGQPDISLGNVVGSNIFNVLVILGLSAVAAPLAVARQLIRQDVWVMMAVSGLLLLLGLDLRIDRAEGVGLLLAGAAYTAWLIRISRRETSLPGDSSATLIPSWRGIAYVIAGLAMLVLGAGWLVDGAVGIARIYGVSELVIGLTIVAGGTSLPELATSLMASLRGERDIAVGNVVGSNIFNILAVLGGSAALSPSGVAVAESALLFDIPVMVAVALACLPIFFSGHTIDRWEGVFFLGCYVAYTLYLVLDATRSSALDEYRLAMIGFALPLIVVTLVIIAARSLRKQGSTPD